MKFSPYSWSAGDMIGGDPAVDFVNTASNWGGEEPVDRLGGFAALADWTRLAGLFDETGVAQLKAAADGQPGSAEAAFADALALRLTLWRLFSAAAHGAEAGLADLAALKHWTRRAALFLDLRQTGDGFRDEWTDETPPFEAPLFKIALAAEALLKEGPVDRLHACNGEHCEWMFLDLSKNASRRWCSMSTCGNDAKVKKFRKRTKS